MILDLDFGNTVGKWRVIDANNSIVARGFCDYSEPSVFLNHVPEKIKRIRSVSVLAIDNQKNVFQQIEKHFALQIESVVVTGDACELINGYENPSRLGADRWAAIVAAWQHVKDACIVVDAGSALTIDCIDANGHHHGGYIIPGLALMGDTLIARTGKIRIEAIEIGLSPGINTEQAVGHGSVIALVAAINSAYEHFMQHIGVSPVLILTGGDAKTLLPFLSLRAVHRPDLVFDGLALLLP